MSEQTYFQQFSGYSERDDAFWDVWAILYADDAYCHKECNSREEALAEAKRIHETFPDIHLTIEHKPKVGFGDMRLSGHARYWPIEKHYA